MTVIIAMYDDGIGVIEQRTPTEERDLDDSLQGAGKGRKAGAFQEHGAHIGVLGIKITCRADKLSFGFGIIGAGWISAQSIRPEVIEFCTLTSFHRSTQNIATGIHVDPHRLQVAARDIGRVGHQDADWPVWADDLAGKRCLEQRGHKDGDTDRRGHFALEIGEIAAFAYDCPAAHILQAASGPQKRFEAGGLVFIHHQPLDIYSAGDFVLDWKWVAAGVANIAWETGIDVIQQNHAQPHAVGAAVGAGSDFVDS